MLGSAFLGMFAIEVARRMFQLQPEPDKELYREKEELAQNETEVFLTPDFSFENVDTNPNWQNHSGIKQT